MSNSTVNVIAVPLPPIRILEEKQQQGEEEKHVAKTIIQKRSHRRGAFADSVLLDGEGEEEDHQQQ